MRAFVWVLWSVSRMPWPLWEAHVCRGQWGNGPARAHGAVGSPPRGLDPVLQRPAAACRAAVQQYKITCILETTRYESRVLQRLFKPRQADNRRWKEEGVLRGELHVLGSRGSRLKTRHQGSSTQSKNTCRQSPGNSRVIHRC